VTNIGSPKCREGEEGRFGNGQGGLNAGGLGSGGGAFGGGE
jgi:hypothetical protein